MLLRHLLFKQNYAYFCISQPYWRPSCSFRRLPIWLGKKLPSSLQNDLRTPVPILMPQYCRPQSL